MIVYGGCVEPGGMKLDNESYYIDCPQCGREASKHSYERCEGSINHYYSVQCNYCGYRDGNDDDEYPDPGFYNPQDDYPEFWQEDRLEETAAGFEPITAISGPTKTEWMTRDDLLALAQGQALMFSQRG